MLAVRVFEAFRGFPRVRAEFDFLRGVRLFDQHSNDLAQKIRRARLFRYFPLSNASVTPLTLKKPTEQGEPNGWGWVSD